MRPYYAVTRGDYKLWTNARGTTLFTAAWRTPARTIEPGHPLCKTRPDKIVESQWDEEDATKTKMTNVECNVIPINLEPHTRLCLVTQSTEIQVLGMAKKKKMKIKSNKSREVENWGGCPPNWQPTKFPTWQKKVKVSVLDQLIYLQSSKLGWWNLKPSFLHLQSNMVARSRTEGRTVTLTCTWVEAAYLCLD